MPLSDHPIDQLIRELIQTGRPPTSAEIDAIIERIATAPFDRRNTPVPSGMRGLSYQGQVLGDRADALTYHLVKRVVTEQQWSHGTTASQYLADLSRAVRARSARLMIYARRGGHMAATLTPTQLAIPPLHRSTQSRSGLFVVFSADRGIIVTGYQVSGDEEIAIPEGAQWLK
jgi:hypothetical protein